jgi:hypothetical protein
LEELGRFDHAGGNRFHVHLNCEPVKTTYLAKPRLSSTKESDWGELWSLIPSTSQEQALLQYLGWDFTVREEMRPYFVDLHVMGKRRLDFITVYDKSMLFNSQFDLSTFCQLTGKPLVKSLEIISRLGLVGLSERYLASFTTHKPIYRYCIGDLD